MISPNIPSKALLDFIIANDRNWRTVELAEEVQAGASTIEKINQLDLSACSLESLPDEICDLPGLLHLNISANFLTSLPERMTNLKKLKVILLRCNAFTEVPNPIQNMPWLNKVDILGNPIEKVPVSLSKIIWSLPNCWATWTND